MPLTDKFKHDLSVVAFESTKRMTLGQRVIVRDALDAIFPLLDIEIDKKQLILEAALDQLRAHRVTWKDGASITEESLKDATTRV